LFSRPQKRYQQFLELTGEDGRAVVIWIVRSFTDTIVFRFRDKLWNLSL